MRCARTRARTFARPTPRCTCFAGAVSGGGWLVGGCGFVVHGGARLRGTHDMFDPVTPTVLLRTRSRYGAPTPAQPGRCLGLPHPFPNGRWVEVEAGDRRVYFRHRSLTGARLSSRICAHFPLPSPGLHLVPAPVYDTIETMLPGAKDKLLELWAEPQREGRPGWTRVSFKPPDTGVR